MLWGGKLEGLGGGKGPYASISLLITKGSLWTFTSNLAGTNPTSQRGHAGCYRRGWYPLHIFHAGCNPLLPSSYFCIYSCSVSFHYPVYTLLTYLNWWIFLPLLLSTLLLGLPWWWTFGSVLILCVGRLFMTVIYVSWHWNMSSSGSSWAINLQHAAYSFLGLRFIYILFCKPPWSLASEQKVESEWNKKWNATFSFQPERAAYQLICVKVHLDTMGMNGTMAKQLSDDIWKLIIVICIYHERTLQLAVFPHSFKGSLRARKVSFGYIIRKSFAFLKVCIHLVGFVVSFWAIVTADLESYHHYPPTNIVCLNIW